MSVQVIREVLPSGLTVILEPLPHVRSVALGYYLRSGSAAESEENSGASHFLEHLVFKGTETRSTADIARLVDLLGGDVDAFTGKEYTSFYAHVLDEQCDDALDLLTDIVVNPRYSDEDMELERGVILEEIKMVEDTPDDLVGELFLDAFWSGHPLGRPILGTDVTVRRLTRANIQAHYQETFHPSNVIFSASGHFDPERVIAAIDDSFSRATGAGTRYDWDEPKPNQNVTLRRKSELEQVHVFLGMRGYAQQAEERFAAAIYNMVLGGGMSSRLFQNIREKEGLVYTVSSYHSGYLHGGYEAIYAATNPSNLQRVLELTLAELRNLKKDGVTPSELEDAKRAIKGSILLSLESTVSRMSGLARQEYYFGRQFTPDEIIDRIEAVGIEDIRRIADATVDPESISLTLLGNLDEPGVTVEDLRGAVA